MFRLSGIPPRPNEAPDGIANADQLEKAGSPPKVQILPIL